MAPWTAAILFALGLIVLPRFAFGIGANVRRRDPSRAGGAGVGLVGGVVDAIGGGGGGPIDTPPLLTATKLQPRHVTGSVAQPEFPVSFSAHLGFILVIGPIALASHSV